LFLNIDGNDIVHFGLLNLWQVHKKRGNEGNEKAENNIVKEMDLVAEIHFTENGHTVQSIL
jgi:hypothetical protein